MVCRYRWSCSVLFLFLLGLPQTQPICAPQLDVIKFQCSHMRLIEVPGNINRHTEELDLSHNLLEVLHEDSFHRLHSLRRLILSDNKIYKITERAFLAVAHSLTYLDLRNNHIMSNSVTSFPVTALAPLIQLTYLDLSGNPLAIIPTGFLRYMGANLTQLDLSAIPMKVHIQPGAFRGLARLHRLNFAGNTFGEFNEEAFEGLRPAQFSQLSLHGVQWRCDCRLLWFRRWLNHVPRKALFADPLPGGECISPPAFKGRSLLFLNFTDLQCAPRLLSTIPPSHELDTPEPVHVVALDGYNLTLSCVFVSEPKMQVHWYQNGVLIQPHWTRFTQTTTSGTKFTTSLHFHRLNSQLDIGNYQCQTSNQKGSAGKNFMVDVKPHLTPDHASTRTMTSTQAEPPIMQAQELGKYLIILSIIAASNIVFFIVGAITYKCIKCHQRVRRKQCSTGDQTTHVVSNGSSNPPVTHPPMQTEIDSPGLVPLLSVQPGSTLVTTPMMNNPRANFHCTQYNNYSVPEWQEPHRNMNLVGPDILPPAAKQLQVFPNKSTFAEQYRHDLAHILSPHRTKRLHAIGDPPSPMSSDMGYSASTSSRTADRSDPSADRTNSVYRTYRPESVSKPYPHYTLTLKQNESNKTELVYEPTLAGGEKGPSNLRINPPCMRETSLAPRSQSLQKDKAKRFHEPDDGGMVASKTNISTRILNVEVEEDLDPSCPIHGTDRRHSCAVHSVHENGICPVHGSLLDTTIDNKPNDDLYTANNKSEAEKQYHTWASDRSTGHNRNRHSNPNLASTIWDYMSPSNMNVNKPWKSVLRNNTLPR